MQFVNPWLPFQVVVVPSSLDSELTFLFVPCPSGGNSPPRHFLGVEAAQSL